MPGEGFLGGKVLFGEGDLLALAGEEEFFEFPIGEEGFDLGSEEAAVAVIEGDEATVEGGIEGGGKAEAGLLNGHAPAGFEELKDAIVEFGFPRFVFVGGVSLWDINHHSLPCSCEEDSV